MSIIVYEDDEMIEDKMNALRAGLLNEIERVAWMDESDEEIVNSIRGLLYQWSQIQDHVTQDMFGDDDAHISKRKY